MENTNLDGWEEIKENNNIWNPKTEGESIEGVIILKNTGNWNNQTALALNDGKQLILPNHTVLQNKIKDCKIGERIRVIYEKEIPSTDEKKKYGTKIYTILRKKN